MNEQDIWGALFPPCPMCYGDITDKSAFSRRTARILSENPPHPDDLVGWITNPDEYDCTYCLRVYNLIYKTDDP